MPKSAYDLFKEGVDPKQIGNPQLRQQLMRLQQNNYRAQLEQVNANYQAGLAQGLTPGQAATTWVLPNGKNSQYTIKDGDTLPTIAQNAGTTEADILAANPDMKSPQTGMIINTPVQSSPPAPGSEAWRVQNAVQPYRPANAPTYIGGVGIPSNAAQGITGEALSTYREGMQAQALSNRNRSLQTNLTQGTPDFTMAEPPSAPRLALNNPLQSLFGPQYGQGSPLSPQTPTQPQAPKTPTGPRAYAPRGNTVTLLDSITSQIGPDGRVPTQWELNQLISHGRVRPTQQRAAGGGGQFSIGEAFPQGNPNYNAWKRGYIKKGGGGRGGNGGGVQPRYTQERSQPAFSSGAGFGGLVNWRI